MKWVYFAGYLTALLLTIWMVTLDMDCYDEKIIKAEDWNGIVLNKMIDSSQHAVPTVVIKTLDDEEHKIYRLEDEKTNFYEIVQPGDSIYKASGSLQVAVKNKSGEHSFVLKYDCKH